jgi:hypothetical protein
MSTETSRCPPWHGEDGCDYESTDGLLYGGFEVVKCCNCGHETEIKRFDPGDFDPQGSGDGATAYERSRSVPWFEHIGARLTARLWGAK